MKRISSIVFALAMATLFALLPACNTTKGVGKDIEKGGEALKNSADKHGAD